MVADVEEFERPVSITTTRVWGRVVMCIRTDDGYLHAFLVEPELALGTMKDLQRALLQ